MGHGRGKSSSAPEIYSIADELRNNCVGLWPLNDNLPTKVVLDTVGSHHGEATYNTDVMHIEAGKINGCLWTGAGIPNYYVEVPHHGNFNFGADGDFSIALWLKPIMSITSVSLINKFDGTFGFDVYTSSLDKITVDFWGEFGNTTALGETALLWGEWYLLFVTFDRDGTIKIYIDNVLDGESVSIADLGSIDNTHSLIMGAWYDGNYPLPGYLDASMLFKKVLTPAEIAYLWNSGVGRESF